MVTRQVISHPPHNSRSFSHKSDHSQSTTHQASTTSRNLDHWRFSGGGLLWAARLYNLAHGIHELFTLEQT